MEQKDILHALNRVQRLALHRRDATDVSQKRSYYRMCATAFEELLQEFPEDKQQFRHWLIALWTETVEHRPDLVVTVLFPPFASMLGTTAHGRCYGEIEWHLLDEPPRLIAIQGGKQ